MNNLYDIFNHWYCPNGKNGAIWLYGDTHFGDLECYILRFPNRFPQYAGLSKDELLTLVATEEDNKIIRELDEFQIKNINSKVGKNDTLIILGDVGNTDCIKKLRGYKVLILGNHDAGMTNYKREEHYKPININKSEDRDEILKTLINQPNFRSLTKEIYPHYEGDELKSSILAWFDNRLFDEVYQGTLQIGPKIILSHEPVDYEFCCNLHGHNHNVNPLGAYTEKIIDGKSCGGWYNCCAEQIDYTPVSLNSLIKAGILSKVPDVHRKTIDKAIKNKGDNN